GGGGMGGTGGRWARRKATILRCAGTLRRSAPSAIVCRTSWRNSGGTATTPQRAGNPPTSFGTMYSVRIDTHPDIVTEWMTEGGIQTARCDGTTHVPSS